MSDECACLEVCGWTKPHTLVDRRIIDGEVWEDCDNCGTEIIDGNLEYLITFHCPVHNEITWVR